MNSNDLLVTVEEFSQTACFDGKLFGMVTPCDRCVSQVNTCVRTFVQERLLEAQIQAEREVGYNLTYRYHQETIRWDGSRKKVQLKWPGVSDVNVLEQLDPLGSYDVSSIISESIPYVADSGNEYYIATIDSRFFPNPRYAVFREPNGSRVLVQARNGFPRRDVDNNWELALDHQFRPPDDDLLAVQHCRMIPVAGPNSCGGEVVACYPGTEIIIPYAQEPTVIDGVIYYWFYAWSLVDPYFRDETTDFGGADLYKILQTVDFYCVTMETIHAMVFSQDPDSYFCCTDEQAYTWSDEVSVTILNPEEGIIEIGHCPVDCGSITLYLRVNYRTDPATAGVLDELPALREAIGYLAAAELPMEACGCESGGEKSFISKAQMPYSKIVLNPMTGNVYANRTYGDLYGQMVFAEKVSRAGKHYRLMMP